MKMTRLVFCSALLMAASMAQALVKQWPANGAGGGGTVTSVSCSDLSPMFTCTVNNPTTTPEIVFALDNVAANAFCGGPSSGAAAPLACRALLAVDIPVLPDTDIQLSTPLDGQTYQSGLNADLVSKLYSIAGTANQVTVTPGVGTYTFSTPSTFVAPGTIAATTSTTTPILILSGDLNGANPQLNGFGMDGSPTPTFTDTTATGTTTNETAYAFPQATLTSSGSATVTNNYDLYVPNPSACVAPLTCTNRFALGTGGGIRVGTGGITIASGGFFVSGGSTFNGSASFGSSTALTLSSGEIGMVKIAASGVAPGAAGAKLSFVCGTAAGSVKLIAYAGTSTTPVTIVDNIGSGVTGC